MLAGWGGDYKRQNADAYELYRARFPAIEAVPLVGDGATPDGFSLEQAIASAPDLVILSRTLAGTRRGPGDLVQKFEAAGIPVIVIDFFIDPLNDTVPSLRVLGRVIGQSARAEEFIRFYLEKREHLARRLANAKRPSVFMHAHAGGYDCCLTPGRGTLDGFITLAGGRNIAAPIVPGVTGQISLEQLIAADPDIYVATGGTHLAKLDGVVLGLGVPASTAERSFATHLARPGIAALSAVGKGRAFALWHLFNDTPMHIAAIEALATWFHPELFADLDPQATLAEISRRFSAIPLQGSLWLGSRSTAARERPKP